MPRSLRFQLLVAAVLGLLATAGLARILQVQFQSALRSTAREVLRRSAEATEQRVRSILVAAEASLEALEKGLREGWISTSSVSLESNLRSQMAEHTSLRELCWIDKNGEQLCLLRERGDRVVLEPPPSSDPRLHPTYTTLTRPEFLGKALWSDLHWRDGEVVVSLQQAVRKSTLLGVLRVSLDGNTLNQAVGQAAEPGHLTYLVDDLNRLVTAPSGQRHYVETDDGELRLPDAPVPLSLSVTIPVRAGQHYWSVVTSADAELYLGPLRELERLAWWLLALATIAVALLWTRLNRRFSEDLLALSSSAKAFQNYDFKTVAKSYFEEFEPIEAALESARLSLSTLSKFAPAALVRRIHSSQRAPQLGGEICEVAVLFSDLVNFTAWSEKLEPQQLGEALGHYFEEATGVIHQQGGIVDKYIGDAIMALFNVPEPQAQPIHSACRAALAHLKVAQQCFSQSQVRLCQGIHWAEVCVGNFGAPDRMHYTALGDGVNLASRLESLNRHYGTNVLVSEPVFEKCRDDFEFQMIDRVAVKGRQEPVTLFALLGPKGDWGSTRVAEVSLYARAWDLYVHREFGEAGRLWNEIPTLAAQRMAQRALEFAQNPPGQDWRAIHTWESK